jgi:hypothetical protein
MRLPIGAPYKLISTKSVSQDSLLDQLASEGFSGYLRISVDRKGWIEDGFLLIRDGKILGAEYLGKERLFSQKAWEEVKEVWKLEGIIDIVKFNDYQIQLSIEENQDTLLLPITDGEETVPERLDEEEVEELERNEPGMSGAITTSEEELAPVESLNVPPPQIKEEKIPEETIEVSRVEPHPVEKDILEKRMERMALLKKFGLKEPEDEFVNSILQKFSLPSDKELNSKSRELKMEILKRLRQTTKLEELDLYINPAKVQDMVEFNIDVYVKPLNKKIEEEVKLTIENTLKEKLKFPYQKGLKINAA